MKQVKIYQVKREYVMNYGFADYDLLIKLHGGIDFKKYEKVYDCQRLDNYTFDEVFHEFNINRPEDFHGHSLSISDIIVMDNTVAYTDFVGFVTM